MSSPQTDPPFATLPEALAAQSAARCDADALTWEASSLSYGELRDLVDELAGRLRRVGVDPGDRVAILGINSPEWIVAFLASLELSAIAVPLNYRLSAREVVRQLDLVQPRVILYDDHLGRSLGDYRQSERARTLGRGGDQQRSIWRVPSMPAARGGGRDVGGPALISFTSGSTGTPKGASISHRALTAAANAYAQILQTTEQDTTLVLVPLFHNTGFCDQLAHMLLVGGCCDLLPEFTTADARAALRRRPASYLIAVPGILRLLALGDDAQEIFSGARIACYGGSPMPRAWSDEFAARWPKLGLYNCYGLTEFTSVSHILGPTDMASHPGTVGRPVPGVQQRIVGVDGSPAEAGTAGELLLAGPTRMLGYWEAPDLTAQAFADHWLRTGDVGLIDEDGFLELVGRASDVINRGGEKISPIQVEAALNLEPQIGDAAVIGAPHPIFGECVIAFVTLRGTAELDEESLVLALRDRVADYAIPERFLVLDELPRNAAGKTDRRELRRYAETEFEGVAS